MGKKPDNLIFRIIKDNTITNAHDFRVLVVLADCVSAKYGYAFPSLTTLADRAAISRRAAVAAVARLEKAGRITVDRDGRSNRYRIVVSAISSKVVQQSNQCSKVTSAADALVQQSNQTSAADAPVLVQQMHSINLTDKPTHKPTPPPSPPKGDKAQGDMFKADSSGSRKVGKADAEKDQGQDGQASAVSDEGPGRDSKHPPAKKKTAQQKSPPQAADAAPRQDEGEAGPVPIHEQMRLIWNECRVDPIPRWRVVNKEQRRRCKEALDLIRQHPEYETAPLEGWRATLLAMQNDPHLMGDNDRRTVYARPQTILNKDQKTLSRIIDASIEGNTTNGHKQSNGTNGSTYTAILEQAAARMGERDADLDQSAAGAQPAAGSDSYQGNAIDLEPDAYRIVKD